MAVANRKMKVEINVYLLFKIDRLNIIEHACSYVQFNVKLFFAFVNSKTA